MGEGLGGGLFGRLGKKDSLGGGRLEGDGGGKGGGGGATAAAVGESETEAVGVVGVEPEGVEPTEVELSVGVEPTEVVGVPMEGSTVLAGEELGAEPPGLAEGKSLEQRRWWWGK